MLDIILYFKNILIIHLRQHLHLIRILRMLKLKHLNFYSCSNRYCNKFCLIYTLSHRILLESTDSIRRFSSLWLLYKKTHPVLKFYLTVPALSLSFHWLQRCKCCLYCSRKTFSANQAYSKLHIDPVAYNSKSFVIIRLGNL